jgi:hypothetical protein
VAHAAAPHLDAETSDSRRLWGWVLGWALTSAAVCATGGTAGWRQSPAWSAILGLSLGVAAMFAGARWSGREPREAATWAGAFLLAVGILESEALGDGLLAMFLGAGLVGLLGDLVGGRLAGRGFHLERSLRWGVGFALCGFMAFFPGIYLAQFAGIAARRLIGSQEAQSVGFVLGSALVAGAFGALAAVIGGSDD